MAAMFFILGLLLYIQGRTIHQTHLSRGNETAGLWPWVCYGGCLFSGLLALASKENAAMLPAVILLFEWFFFQHLKWPTSKSGIKWLILTVLVMAVISIFFFKLDQKTFALYGKQSFTLPQRLLSQLRIILYYISLFFYPDAARLNLDYDYPLSMSLFEPVTTLVSLSTLLGLTCLVIYAFRKNRILSFCIVWFFINLFIESSFIGLALIFEHRTYLPFMMPCLIIVISFFRHIKYRSLSIALLSMIIFICSVWTYQRNAMWNSEIRLWEDCLAKSPHKARPSFLLGHALHNQGQTEEAVDLYYQALRHGPYYAEAHNSLGVALKTKGHELEAITHYVQAIEINPDYAEAHNNLAILLEKQKRIDEAYKHYFEALRINPDYHEAHNNLGSMLEKQKKVDEARMHFSEALRIEPEYASAHNNMGIMLLKQGRIEKAITHLSKAIRIKPDLWQSHLALGLACAQKGDIPNAIASLQISLRLNPENMLAKKELNKLMVRKEKPE